MADYRRSYGKTVLAISLVAAGGTASVAWLLRAAWLGFRAWGPGSWIAWGGGILVLVLVTGCAFLVVAGGLISLHRDALEARGVPYAPRKPREWIAGPAVQALRRALRMPRGAGASSARLGLRPGELVEVRSLPEILATLDDRGTLDALPFMPEMSVLCGRRFRVHRRVDKLNDWIEHTGLRRLRDTVLLEQVRCDGSGHGGCQTSCHIRWKEAWLRRAMREPGGGAAAPAAGASAGAPPAAHGAPPLEVADLRRLASREENGEARYTCQGTELARGTTPLRKGDPRHYARDLLQGNIRLGPWATGIAIGLFNWVQRKRRGVTYPNVATSDDAKSPTAVLNLRPGEDVRVKAKAEIEPTLNKRNRNRGLWFDGEMLRFCGGRYRVQVRAERLMDEQTGRLRTVENPCIILEGVTASGEYLGFCAQNEAILWREIWLERVDAEARPS